MEQKEAESIASYHIDKWKKDITFQEPYLEQVEELVYNILEEVLAKEEV